MAKQLILFKNLLQTCELAKKIIDNSFLKEEFEQLIALNKEQKILSNFTLENGENIIISALSDQKNHDRIVDLLTVEPELMLSFIKYCLEKQQYDLLRQVFKKLSNPITEKLIQELLNQVETREHLNLALEIMERNDKHSRAYSLIKNTLDDNLAIHKLILIFTKYYGSSKENENFLANNEEYAGLAKRLMTICLRERYNNEISQLELEYRNPFIQATWDYYLLQKEERNFFNKYSGRLASILPSLIGKTVYYKKLNLLKNIIKLVSKEGTDKDLLAFEHTLASRSNAVSRKDLLDFKKELRELLEVTLQNIPPIHDKVIDSKNEL